MDHYIYNFGLPSLANQDYILWSWVHIYLKIIFPRGREGGIKISFSLTYRCNIRYLVKIGPVVLEKEMLTDDDGHQAIAKSHLNDSGDRETWYMEIYMIIVAISLMHFYH